MHMRFPFGKKNGNSEGTRKRGTELIRKHKRLFALAFVMIIGAGIGQVPLIERAKKKRFKNRICGKVLH